MLQFSIMGTDASSRLYWISGWHIRIAGSSFHGPMLHSDDHSSERGLEAVGAVTVLEAMVEQRVRRSSIPPPPPSLELCPEDDEDGSILPE